MGLIGQLFALGAAACWSITSILFSFGGRRVGSAVVNRSRLLFALVFITITHFALEGSPIPQRIEPSRLAWLSISSVLGLVLGDSFLFQAHILIGPQLSSLMMATAPILTTFLGWLFLGELLDTHEIVGIILTVAGIAWVVTERRGQSVVVEDKQYKQGILFGLLGALGQASNLVTVKFGLTEGYPTISATWIRILVAMLVLWLFAGLRGRVRPTLTQWRDRPAFRAILAGTITGPFLGIWFSLIAVQLTRVGIASTLMALPPVILIPLERVLFGVRVSFRSISGTFLAIIGVAVILLLG